MIPASFMVYGLSISALDGCDTGENLAFDGFEESAATGGDVADFISETELVDTCH